MKSPKPKRTILNCDKLRLFVVLDAYNNHLADPAGRKFFASKQVAKVCRDWQRKAGFNARVSLGPDHWRAR